MVTIADIEEYVGPEYWAANKDAIVTSLTHIT